MLRIRLVLLTAVVAVGGLAPSTAAARGSVLPKPTYDAALAISNALVPLDRDEPSTPAQLNAVRAACKAVPKGGALLTSMRRDCDATVALYVAATAPCTTEKQCRRMIGPLADATERAVRQTTSSDRVVDRTVPRGACRTALRSSPTEIAMMREMAKATRALERAMRRNDAQAIEAAGNQIERVDDSKARSAATIRNQIRDRC